MELVSTAFGIEWLLNSCAPMLLRQCIHTLSADILPVHIYCTHIRHTCCSIYAAVYMLHIYCTHTAHILHIYCIYTAAHRRRC